LKVMADAVFVCGNASVDNCHTPQIMITHLGSKLCLLMEMSALLSYITHFILGIIQIVSLPSGISNYSLKNTFCVLSDELCTS
jgi:hypothetical protein